MVKGDWMKIADPQQEQLLNDYTPDQLGKAFGSSFTDWWEQQLIQMDEALAGHGEKYDPQKEGEEAVRKAHEFGIRVQQGMGRTYLFFAQWFLENAAGELGAMAVLRGLRWFTKAQNAKFAVKAEQRIKAVAFGKALAGQGDDLLAAAKWLQPEKGYFDVLVHGDEAGSIFWVTRNQGQSWIPVTHRSLATFVKKSGWKGEKIRLISCWQGNNASGAAKNLANKLGVNVKAPTDKVWVWSTGQYHIGPDEFTNSGAWVEFCPGK